MERPFRLLVFGIIVLGCLAFSPSVSAATKTWDSGGANDNCSTDLNWSGDTKPTSGDDVVIDSTSDAIIWDSSCPDTVLSLSMNSGFTGSVTVNTIYASGFQVFTITNDLTINAGTMKHASNTTTETNRLKLAVGGNFTLGASGTINVDSLGFSPLNGTGSSPTSGACGGASYGGLGGNFSSFGTTYGSITAPTNLGSGAEHCSNAAQKSGGGAVYVTTTGSSTISGTITANGGTGASSNDGGAAGGSVFLTTATISGAGTIRANGGGATSTPGAGGGGRVALVLTGGGADFSSLSATVTADGGDHSTANMDGAAGTVYKETTAQGAGAGALTIANFSGASASTLSTTLIPAGQTWSPATITVNSAGRFQPQNGTSVTPSGGLTIASGGTLIINDSSTIAANITVQSGGNIAHSANSTAETYMMNLTVTGNVTVDSGGTISVDSLGYSANTGPGSRSTAGACDGGSYGGYGGDPGADGYGTAVTYGSAVAPTNIGSGGTPCNGSSVKSGGGIVRMTISGALAVAGTISSNGAAGGGSNQAAGSGGSVNITTGTITGAGTIRANGGAATSSPGAGGGGRVAVILTGASADFSGFSGTIQAIGGDHSSASADGAAGTVYKQTTAQGTNGGDLTITNFSGASTAATAVTALDDNSSRSITVGTVALATSGKFTIGSNDTLTTGGTGTTVTIASGTTLAVSGTLSAGGAPTPISNSGTFTISSGSTVNFTGQSDDTGVTIPANTYYTLGVNNARTIFTQGGTVTVSTALNVTNGIYSLNGQSLTATSATISNTDTIRLNGTETVTGFTNDTDSGTVQYVGTTNATGLKLGNTYNSLLINDGLIGYWKLDESSAGTFADSSGYGVTGTGTGAAGTNNTPQPASTVPTVGFTDAKSLNFDGTDDYVSLGTSAPPSALTWSAWIKASGLADSVGRTILGSGASDGNSGTIFGFYGVSGVQSIRFSVYNDVGGNYRFWQVTTPSPAVADGTWQHIVVTQASATSTPVIYVNGISQTVTLPTTAGTVTRLSLPYAIGRNGGSSAGYFLGNIDDVRTYNRVLTATEVSSLAAGTQPGSATATYTLNAALTVNGDLTLASGGIDVSSTNYGITEAGSWFNYGGVFTAQSGTVTLSSTASGKTILSGNQHFYNLTASGSGGAWTLADRLFVDNTLSQTAGTIDVSSSNYNVIATAFSQTAGTFTAQSGTVTAKATSAQTLTAASSLYNLQVENPNETSLVGYWKLDEGVGTTAKDSTTNANNGTLTNSPAWSTSTPGIATFDNPYSLSFDGTDDFVAIGTPASLFNPTFTISAWVNGDSAMLSDNKYHSIVGSSNVGATSIPFNLYLYRSGISNKIAIDTDNGTTAVEAIDSTSLVTGAWQHFVGTYNGSTMLLYRNGVQVATASGSITPTTNQTIAIGKYGGFVNAVSVPWKGYIDDVRIYSTALSATQVSNLYAGKYANTGSGATTTLGAALTVTNALTIQAGTLDVSSSNYAITSPTWTDNGVFAARAGTVTLNNTGTLTDANSSPFYNFTLNGSSKTVTLGTAMIVANNLTITAGTLDVSASNYGLTIGGNFANSGTFTKRSGTVTFDGTLSNSSTVGLVGYWKLDEASGTYLADSSGFGHPGVASGSSGSNTSGPAASATVPTPGFTDDYSRSFDGTDDVITVPTISALTSATTFTMSAWMKRFTSGKNVAVTQGSASNNYTTLDLDIDGVFYLEIYDNGVDKWGQVALAGTDWHHIVMVFDGSQTGNANRMKGYVDGVQKTLSFVGTIPATSSSNTDTLAIGRYAASTKSTGNIDDVRVYNNALTPGQVYSLYTGGQTTATTQTLTTNASGLYGLTHTSGSTLQLADALTFTSALTNNAGYVDLNGKAVTATGATVSNTATIKATGGETMTGFTNDTDSGTVFYTPAANQTGFNLGNSYNNLTINDGLIGYWKFDAGSGTNAADSSGYGNTGTLTNGPTWSSTVPTLGFTDPYSLSFDGTNDYVATTWNSTAVGISTGPISISLWMKSSATTNERFVFDTTNNSFTLGGVLIDFRSDIAGKYISGYFVKSGAADSINGTAALNDNAWHHIVFLRNGTNILLYVDGSQNASGTDNQRNISSTTNAAIGAQASGAAFQFVGNVDDVRIYNRALIATEISSLNAGMQPGSATYTFTQNAALTVNGDLTLASGGLDVSGSNYGITDAGSWLNYGGVLTPRSGTVTLSATATGKTIQSGNQHFKNLTVSGSGGGFTLADRLFVDGTYAQSAATVDVSSSNYAVDANVFAQTAGTFTAQSGTVSTLATTSSTLTAASSLYNLNVATDSNLTGYWKLDEGTGTTAKDASGGGRNGTLTNGPTWSATVPTLSFTDPYSLSFDGSDDYVDLGGGSIPVAGTISLWFKASSLSSAPHLWVMRNSDDSKEYRIYWQSNALNFSVYDNGAYQAQLTSAFTDTSGWHNVVGTWKVSNAALYVDGSSVATDTSVNVASGTISEHRLGKFTLSGQNFAGLMDDVRTYNVALTSGQVSNLFAGNYASGGAGTTTTTLGAALTVTNALTNVGGTLDVSGSNYGITTGTWANYATFTPRSGTLTLTNTGTLADTTSFYNVTINGSGKTVTLGAALTTTNNLTITAGTLDVSTSNYAVNVAGAFTNNGTFNARTGTVTLNGTNQSIVVAATTTFSTLIKTVTSAATLTMQAGQTIIIQVALTLQGALNNLLTLVSSIPGTAWLFNPQGTATLNYLNITDATNSNASAVTANNSKNTARNTNITFSATTVTWTGTTNTDWGTATNWDVGYVPNSTDNIVIPNTTNKPLLDTDRTVNNLTISHASAILDLNTHNLTMTGTFSNTGTLKLTGAETLTGFTNDATNGTILYYGTSTYTTLHAGNTYNNVTFNGSGGSWTAASSTTVNGVLTVTAGTYTVAASTTTTTTSTGTTISIGASGTLTNNGTLSIGGAPTPVSNSGTWTNASTSTVIYTGQTDNTGVTVPNIAYGNVTFNKTGTTFTLGAALTVSANLTITAGTLDVSGSNFSITVAGNFTNSGTFTKRSGTVNLTGLGAQTLTSGGSGFYGLNVNSTDSGLVGYWKLDEGTGTSTADSSGGGNTGTLVNSPTWSTNISSTISFTDPYALTFNGSDTSVTVPHNNSFNAYPITVSTWMKSTDTVNQNSLVNMYPGGGNGWYLYLQAGEVRAWYFSGVAGFVYGGQNSLHSSNIADGTWHQVAFTIDASGGAMYVDGTQVRTQGWSGTPAATTQTAGLVIGRYPDGAFPFNGSLDDIRIYNRALSGSEISTLAGGGTGFGTYTVQDALNASNALTITNGTLDLSTFNLTTTGATFSNLDTLALAGGQTFTGFTNDTDSGTVKYNGSSTYTGLAAGSSYNYLTFNGSGTWRQSAATTANKNLNIVNGTFGLNSYNFNLPSSNVFSNTGTLALNGTETISNFTLDTDSGTVLYNGGSTYTGLDLGNTYYNLSFNAAGSYTLTGNLTVGNNLTITAGTVDVSTSNYAVNVAGNLTNSGTLTPRSSIFTLNGTSQTLTPGSLTFYQLLLTGSSGTVTLGSDFSISNLISVAAGRTLAIATKILNAAVATITNLGNISFGSGGQLQHASSDFYLARSTSYDVATGLSIGVDSIYATITDQSAQLNGAGADTVSITLTCAHDSEAVTLTETGNATYTFRSGTPIILGLYSGSATNNSGTLSCTDGETITASYTDAHDTSDTNSATATATVDTLPTAPSGLSGVPAKTSIAWSFTDNSNNEASFKVYDTSNTLKTTCTSTTGSATGGTITCTETGLTKGTSYTRKVVSSNVAGNSSYSSSVSVTTKAEPNAPTSFNGSVTSSTSITWTWNDNSDDEDGWILQNEAGTTIKTLATANLTSYTETGLTKGTSYTRKMVAYNEDGNSTASNTKEVTTGTTAPSAATLLAPVNGATLNTGLPSFSFTKATDSDDGVDFYTLHVGSLTFTSIPESAATASNPLSATHSTDTYTAQYFNENDGNDTNDTINITLKDGNATLPLTDGTYTWYVTATDNGDNEKDSTSRTFTVDTSKPQVKGITVSGATLAKGIYTMTTTSPTITVSSSAGTSGTLSQLVILLEQANTVLGATTSYTAIESSTYTLTGKTATTVFTPKNALTAGKSYRVTFTLTDAAGNTTSQSITLSVLTAQQAAEQAIANLDANTTPTNDIIDALRGTLKPSAINFPQLEQTALLRRQAQAEKFTAFTDQLNRFIAYILKGQGPLERFLAFLLNSAATAEQHLLAWLQGATQTVLAYLTHTWQLAMNMLGQTWTAIAQAINGLSQRLARIDIFTPLNRNLTTTQQATVSAQSLIAARIHTAGQQTGAFLGRVGTVFASGRDTRIRSGLANRQAVTTYLVGVLRPVQATVARLTLQGRAIYQIVFNKTPTIITNVQVTALSPTSAVVAWQTNHVTRLTKVNYGVTTNYGQEVVVADLNDHHEVTLPNLLPSTTYYFEVMNQEGGKYVFDAYYTLTTPATTDQQGKSPLIPQEATIIGDTGVSVYDQPSPTSGVVTTVHPGEHYRALLQQDGWIAILLPSGGQGWIREDEATLQAQTDSTSVDKNRF